MGSANPSSFNTSLDSLLECEAADLLDNCGSLSDLSDAVEETEEEELDFENPILWESTEEGI